MKQTNKYYFSVEGETELWYFDWLEKLLNAQETATRKVSFDVKKKNPISYVKGLSILHKVKITHVFDFESESTQHQDKFKSILTEMRESEKFKDVKYFSGYSNFTFELWIILHKQKCNGPLCHRDDYLSLLNHAYSTQFNSLPEYKHQDNFKKLLNSLSLQDVKNAILNSKEIMKINEMNGYQEQKYRNFPYYRENPSLLVYEIVEKILKEIKL